MVRGTGTHTPYRTERTVKLGSGKLRAASYRPEPIPENIFYQPIFEKSICVCFRGENWTAALGVHCFCTEPGESHLYLYPDNMGMQM